MTHGLGWSHPSETAVFTHPASPTHCHVPPSPRKALTVAGRLLRMAGRNLDAANVCPPPTEASIAVVRWLSKFSTTNALSATDLPGRRPKWPNGGCSRTSRTQLIARTAARRTSRRQDGRRTGGRSRPDGVDSALLGRRERNSAGMGMGGLSKGLDFSG